MASLAQDDVKSKDANESNSNDGFNRIGKPITNNEPGLMWSIGYNGYGQHGNGTKNNVEQLAVHRWAKDMDIVKVVHGMTAVVLYIGSGSVIMLLSLIRGFAINDSIRFVGEGSCSYICSDGSLWVSGCNNYGQLALGHTNHVTTATKNEFFAKNGLELKELVSGNYCFYQMALTKDGQLFDVGRNDCYQLGFPDKSNRSQFTKVTFFDEKALIVKQVAGSEYYCTFLTDDGGVYVCGQSGHGALGRGPNEAESKTIQRIDSLNKKAMTQIAGGEYHTLSIDEDGKVWSWGYNNYGQLGQGHKNTTKELPKAIPYFVSNQIKTTKITCGYYHCLSLGVNNRVYAWGFNSQYQCADGTQSLVLEPKMVETLKHIHIVDINAYHYHNVAMSKDSQFFLWGHNGYGQCLTGTKNHVQVPTIFDPKKSSLSGVVLSIHLGYYKTDVITLRNPMKKIQDLRTENAEIQRMLKQMQLDGDAKTKEIESLKEKLSKSYTLSVVQDGNVQNEEKEDEIEAKEKDMTHGDGTLYSKHTEIVSGWNGLTEKLRELAEPLKKGDDDDEKQPSKQQQGVSSADKLLVEYEQNWSLVNQQKVRLKQVQDSHLSELVSHRNKLNVKYLISMLSVSTRLRVSQCAHSRIFEPLYVLFLSVGIR